MKNTTILKTSNSGKNLRFWHFCLMAFLLSVTGMFAQTGTIGIGNGTAVNSYLIPVYTNYGYNYTQQIVTASEYSASGGVAGNITKIRYYIDNAEAPLANWSSWTVYLGHTSKTSFSSTTDWEPGANLTQVFSGTVTAVSGSWMEIVFTTPFVYNGTSNLVVAIDENSPQWSTWDTYFGSYTGATNTAMYFRDDSVNPNPASPPTATGRTSTLARLQFEGTLASCLAPSGVNLQSVSTDSAIVNWTASTSTVNSGYDYYVSPTNTAPVAGTTPTGNVPTGTSVTVGSLSQNTPYYIWVRSKCSSSDVSGWTPAFTFTTACDAQNVPYTQNFESATVPGLPECTSVQNVGLGNNWVTVNNPGFGFTNKSLRYAYNTDNAANTWFYTKGLNLTAGTSYRLSYRYGNNSGTSYPEKLKVAYGTSSAAASMTLTLADHPNIVNNTPLANVIDFVPTASGVYYIGYNAYSAADMNNMYVDDIVVTLTPSCEAPSALALVGSTENGVNFSWTASSIPPAQGYEFYHSTANTAPGSGVTPTGSVGAGIVTAGISSLTASTTYYVWVRGKCDTGVFSEWIGPLMVTTLCDAPDITSVTGDTICGQGSAELQATAAPGTIFTWYNAATGGAIVGTGATFNTPVITSTTNYYVEANTQPSYFVGATYTGNQDNDANVGSHGVAITTTAPNVTINSVDIPFTGTGTFTISVRNTSNDATIASVTTGTVTGLGTTVLTVPLQLTVPAAGNYLLIISSITGNIGNLGYTTGTFPYATTGAPLSVTSGYWYGTDSSNLYFYNLNVTQGCISARQMVTATVTTAPAVNATVTESSICSGQSTSISAASTNANYNYTWMPGSLTGATQTVTPAQTTTYTVTATDPGTGCVTTATVTVTVNPLPPMPTLPDSVAVCESGSAVAVTASLPAISTILSQNFNAATNDWTTINNSTGGTPANAAWTLRPDGHTLASYGTYHSNDNTQFYHTNSDAQGSGSTASTILRSPSFSTMGYASASVSFFHHLYEPSANSSTGKVEASTDGTTWVTLQTYGTTTGAYGTFANANVVLTAPFINQPVVYVRFKFDGNWRYFWAIDNVSITGQQNVNITWSPQTGLYTNAEATTAYTGQPAATVYAKPAANTTYTVTATGSTGCTVTDTVEVTLSSTSVPTVANTTQPFCGSATVADLDVEGDNIKWYTAMTGGTLLTGTTVLTDGSSYYASQTVNGCESLRVAVTADINTTDAPVVEDAEQSFCYGATIADLEATGTAIQWYSSQTGGTMIPMTELLANGATFYASQTVGTCESTGRTAVTVAIVSVDSPEGDEVQEVTVGTAEDATIEDLEADSNGEITWYPTLEDAMDGTNAIEEGTQLQSGATYYAMANIGDCKSENALAVTVDVILGNGEFSMDTFRYHPNPVQNEINVSYTKEITSVAVFNMLGQQVVSQQPNSVEAKVDMSGLADGNYILKVTSGDAVKTIKVVKKQ
jgi:hypothetical protein